MCKSVNPSQWNCPSTKMKEETRAESVPEKPSEIMTLLEAGNLQYVVT